MKKLFSLVLLCSFSGAIWATDMGAAARQVPAFAEATAGQVPSSLGEPATAGQAETKGEEVVGALVYGDGEIPLTQSRVDLFEVVRVALAEESGFAESRSRRFQINSEMFTREVFEALRGYFQVGVESLRELSGEQLVDLLALLDYLGMDFKVGVGQELKTNLLSLLKNRLSLEAVVAAANKLSGMPGSSEMAELGYEIRAQRIGFSPDDRFVWAMSGHSGRWQIQLYDLGNGSLQAIGDAINGNDSGFSPDGKWAWVADAPGDNHSSSKIQIYRFDNGRLLAVGDLLEGSKVKFSPNGRLVQIWNSGQISLYKFNQGILEKVRDLFQEEHFSPDGRWCWIGRDRTSRDLSIFEVDQDGFWGPEVLSKRMNTWAGSSPDWKWFWIGEGSQFYPQIKLYKFIDGHLDGAGEFYGFRMGFSSDNKFVWVDIGRVRDYIQVYAFRKGVLKPVGEPFVGGEVEFSQSSNWFRVIDEYNHNEMKLYRFRDESFNQVARAQYGLGFSSNEQWFWRVDWSGASIFELALVEYPKELHMKLTLVQQMLVNYLIQRWRSYGVSYALDSDSVLLDIWMRLPDEIRSYLTTIKVVSLVYQYGKLAKLVHRFLAAIGH